MKKQGKAGTGMEIAVIGMAGRFPGAKNVREFQDNLEHGRETITFYSEKELETAGVEPGISKEPGYVKSGGGILENKEYFDASFFGYTPREAEIMDPQVRIFHECCWEALEDAGYNPVSYKGLIGLYAGSSPSFYWQGMVELSGKSRELGAFAAEQLANRDYLTARVSYKLNLKGANSTLNTACSTSLTAIHQACRGLLTGESKIALAGGVSITHVPQSGYRYQQGMILSPDGHTRAFDARANGTNAGNGVGVVVLKLLKNALADRDHIHAVILASAVNNDGGRKPGFTAPSVEAQSEVIRKAIRMAKIEPESITYIETHGTATPLGDPVEFEALKRAFKAETLKKKRFCALGTVKTNIGHLDAAAGAASFIKTVLALKRKQIPPSLYYETPNPEIDFENSPFYVNTVLKEWNANGYPLRAGVSSFGIGGTNVHVVLEESPVIGHSSLVIGERKERQYQLILLSAKTPAALDRMTKNLAEYLEKNLLNRGNHENPTNPGPNLADAAYTLQVGRRAFKHRRKLVCAGPQQAVELLSSPGSRQVRTFTPAGENPPIIFMFPGLGSQYVNMGRELYQTQPVFREQMDRAFEILGSSTNYNIKEILYPPENNQKFYGGSRGAVFQKSPPGRRRQEIHRTEISQPVVFAIEYALAKLLVHWGILPYAMIGYSFGEYTAACISGVFSLEDALKLVTQRAQLIQRIPGGIMLNVPLPRKKVEPLLPRYNNLSIAVDNGDTCIVAGPRTAVQAFEKEMKQKRCICMCLENTQAIHSPMMEPILEEFADIMKQIPLSSPQMPYISNVTGNWITVEEARSPGYWVSHLRNTVRFAEGIDILLKEDNAVFLEVGPGNDLTTMIRRSIPAGSLQQAVNLVKHPQKKVPDIHYLLNQLGNLWLYGKNIDWDGFYAGETRYRVPLPTYPFEGQRYWIDMQRMTEANGKPRISLDQKELEQIEEQLEKQLAIKGINDYDGFESITNRLCTGLICDYFNHHHVGTEKAQVYENKEALKQAFNLVPKFEKFFDFFLGVLAEDRIIVKEKHKIRFLESTADVENSIKLKKEAIEKFPWFSGTFESIAYCAGHYPEALSGKKEAISVLFPGGRYFREEPLYKNREEYDNTALYVKLMHRFFFEIICPYLKGKNKNPFRILEVGGGMGSLTAPLAAGIKEQNLEVEYQFTDVGRFFVINAQKVAKKQGLDFMKFGVLDISKEPTQQGYTPHSFDMILALNVVHATPGIEKSIRNLKELLLPGAIMVLLEGSNPPRWMHMIDGLAEGWWYFEDEIRKDSPLLSPGEWEQIMQNQGFQQVMVFPKADKKRSETRCCMIVAQEKAFIETADKTKEEQTNVPGTTLYQRPELTSQYIAPGNEMEKGLAKIFQDLFGIEQVGIEDDFFEMGMDSLIATVLISRIQQELNISVSMGEVYQAAVIRRLADTLKSTEKENMSIIDENLLLLRKGTQQNAHLFLVHGGSGEAAAYREFCDRLHPRLNCWGIRAEPGPGFAPQNITVEERAEKYIKKIQNLQKNGPYYMAGWSSGAPIAFEMVRLLEQKKKQVGFLGIISSTPPPHPGRVNPETVEFTFETEIKWIQRFFTGRDITGNLEQINDIHQLWEFIVNYLEQNNIEIETLNHLLPQPIVEAIPRYRQLGVGEWISYLNVIRSYMNAQALYIPPGKIKTPVHLFEAAAAEVPDKERWNNYTELPYKEYRVNGTHGSIFRVPDVVPFAQLFNKLLGY